MTETRAADAARSLGISTGTARRRRSVPGAPAGALAAADRRSPAVHPGPLGRGREAPAAAGCGAP